MTTWHSDRSTPADAVVAMLRQRGIEANADRLEDHVRADQARRKAHDDDHLDRVRTLATSVWRARRACEAAERCWRIEPGQDTLQAALAGQHARTDAEQALREELLGDDALLAAVLRETR